MPTLAGGRGWDALLEVERDEVLIGLTTHFGVGEDSSFLEVILAAFAITPAPCAESYVLRGPRFLAELIREASEDPVHTAPLPATPEATVLAAALWDPTSSGARASLPACVRTASEILTLAS